MGDEDEEGGYGGLYEDGHWVWDDSAESLLFVSDLPTKFVEAIQVLTKAPTGAIEFRDDVDVIEQIRFRRRYQRKLTPGQADIITLQDVKDIAIYTAPVNILSPMLINLLHLSTTDRFIRAFIFYCQYYLQIADEMANRIIELETKVRTPVCEILETEYRDNLADLRVLVAKEYCTVLIDRDLKLVNKGKIRIMGDEDEEGGYGGLYEDGHWVWDDSAESLLFVSDLPTKFVEAIQVLTKAPTGAIEFRDDVDVIEQIRFRRRYQRKLTPGQADIITLQDVKDIAIYTAPVNILSPMLINLLHLSTTDRFIRAFIFYCQYYLQIADEMANRIIELETKVRTPVCEILETEYRDNLADLRVLVAKEYCTVLIGGSDTRKFHHMGPQKKRRSLSDKDARLFEMLLRMCVQIVWLALGRKSFNQIELEANRIFKSEIFNTVEHTLKTGYVSKMTKEETAVLFGHCLRHDKKLNTRSPLMNEVFCHRDLDYRMMGLGVVKCSQISPRLYYMLLTIAGPEEILTEMGAVLGIIGLPRNIFDTMLRPLPAPSEAGKSKGSMSSQSGYSSKSSGSVKKSTLAMQKFYPDIVLPRKETKKVDFPSSFPDEPEEIRPCSDIQRRRWLNRLNKLLHSVR